MAEAQTEQPAQSAPRSEANVPHPMYKLPPKGEEDKTSGCKVMGISCCQHTDPHGALGEKHECPTNVKRSFHDLSCFLLLIVSWIVMTSVGISALRKGNVAALINPADTDGNICGIDTAVENKPYGYIVTNTLEMVCVDECPSKTADWNAQQNAYQNMICIKDEVSNKYKTATMASSKYYDVAGLFNNGEGPCNLELKTYAVLNWCMFDTSATFPNLTGTGAVGFDDYEGRKITSIFADATDSDMISTNWFMSIGQDLITARNFIFGFGFCVALILAFIFSYLMSTALLDLFVWVSVIIAGGLCAGCGLYMYTTSEQWGNESPRTHEDYEITGLRVVGIIFIAGAALYFCVIWCIRQKIITCCQLVKVAGRAVREMPATVFFPVVQVAALVLFLVPWVYYMLNVYSQGHFEEEDVIDSMGNATTAKVWEWDSTDSSWGSYLMFSYFWTSQFIIAWGQLVYALCFSLWYWAGFDEAQDRKAAVVTKTDEEIQNEHPGCCVSCCICCRNTVCGKPGQYRGNGLLWRAVRLSFWHLGSAAAGSLIIAIIKFIRYIVAKIQHWAETHMENAGEVLKTIVRIVLCCIQSCLYCIEKCMKFINKHAYIIIAMKGKAFCPAAVDSFWLICRNIATISALIIVEEVVAVLGKTVIILGAGACSYFYMASAVGDSVHSLIFPVFFVMILAYFIADMFMSVYMMAIDVMLHNFLADKEYSGDMWAADKKAEHLAPLLAVIDEHEIKEAQRRATELSQVSNPSASE